MVEWAKKPKEFSMEMEMQIQLTLGLRLLVAVLLGGAIGLERERRGHDAGLGTFALVTLGACVFSIVSDLVFSEASDNTRIASGVVEGIGFLGAGIILHGRGGISGLTTAAALWASAAVGMLVGYGLYVLAVLTTIAVILILATRHIGPIANTLEEIREENDTGRSVAPE
jgi:putative Mg2+ transporter-C (MgtC) family protein